MPKFLKIILFIVISIFMTILLCQFYLYLRLNILSLSSTLFRYLTLFLGFIVLIFGYFKRLFFLIILGFCVVFAFGPINYYFKPISNYFYQSALKKSEEVTNKLKDYHQIHNKYPDNLSIIYGKENPNYKVGIFPVYYTYYRNDSTYKLFFNFFDGKTFCMFGNSGFWTICD